MTSLQVQIDETKFLSLSPGEQNLMLYRVMAAFVDSCDSKHSGLDVRCDKCKERLNVLETDKQIAAKTGGLAGVAGGGIVNLLLDAVRKIWA